MRRDAMLLLLLALLGGARAAGRVGPPYGAPRPGGGYYGCVPEVQYVTHYVTKVNEVLVPKTVLVTQVVEEPVEHVVYVTQHEVQTVRQTNTHIVTQTETVKEVNRIEVKETVTHNVYYPDYSTDTVTLQQVQPIAVTRHEATTVASPYHVTLTGVSTVDETVTVPITVTHSSVVAVPQTQLQLETTTVTYTDLVQVTRQPYGYGNELVLVTSSGLEVKPSYVTKVEHITHVVTATNVERVPVYVTETVQGDCGGAPQGYPYG